MFNVKVDALINPLDEECYVAVDGGGTKTEFLLFTKEGEVLNRVMMGASNPNDIGIDNSCALILEGIKKLTLKSGEPQAIFMGVAGIGTAETAFSKTLTAVVKEKTGVKKVKALSDTINLFALNSSAEIIAICGTGVVVVVKNTEIVVGGRGYMLDLAGSGYDVGAAALAAAFDYEEGIEGYTIIRDLICQKKGIDNVRGMIYEVYEKGKRFVAGFAPIVIEAFKLGDKKAAEILDVNMKRLAKLINCAEEASGKSKVLLSGGFINKNRNELLPIIKRYVNSTVELIFSDYPPVYGACKESIRLAGTTRGNNFSENFEKTYALFINK